MKKMVQAEEAAQMMIGILGLYFLPVEYSWWMWIILFLSPDISIIGYLINNKTGAIIYNLFHHKSIAISCFVIGLSMNNIPLQMAGLLFFSHSSFDRMMGYGLKHFDSFKHTHLGQIGNP
ncbi:MAG TPA: DUF4260 domain-containing protein [Segetibacter sp.]|jgi:hypothetical protein